MTETTMTRRHRPLSALEMPYVQTNTISCGTFVLVGRLDVAALRNAYTALRQEFPVLAGQIHRDGDHCQLSVGDPRSTPVFGEEHRPFAPGDVHLDLAPMAQLSGVLVVTDGDHHQVTLGVHHAVADGTHAAHLLLHLWSRYTQQFETSGPNAVTERPLPCSPSETAVRVGVPRNDSPAHRFGQIRSNSTMPTRDDLRVDRFDFRRVVLDAETTAAIRRAAVDAGLGLHAMIAGAVTASERGAMTDVPADVAVPMGVFSPVDLRARSGSAVSATEVTNFAGASRVTVQVTAADTPVEIGRAVGLQLRRDIDDGTVFRDLRGEVTETPASETGVPIRISNIGTMPAPELPGPLRAVDFHTSSHVDMNAVRALVSYAPPGQSVPALMGMHYHVMSFAGRLSVEMRCVPGSLVPGAVDRIESGLVAHLHALADGVDHGRPKVGPHGR